MWIIEKWKQKGLFENKYQSFDFQIRLPTPNLSGTRANDIANLNNPPMPVDSNLLVSISNQNDTVKSFTKYRGMTDTRLDTVKVENVN